MPDANRVFARMVSGIVLMLLFLAPAMFPQGGHVIVMCPPQGPCPAPEPTPNPTPTPTPPPGPTPTPTPSPTPPPLAAGPRNQFLGNESFTYAVPLFSLPGRHGLNLNLALYYSSAYWRGPDSQGYVWPTNNWDLNPGFRLDFGTLLLGTEFGGPALIEPSGVIHPLKDTSGKGTSWTSTDSTNIQVQNDASTGNPVVTYKNGVRVFYPGPSKIEDTNGNIITINGIGGLNPGSATDTVGRTINVITGSTAGATGVPVCVTDGATCNAPNSHTFNFTWSQYTLHYNFAKYLAEGSVQDGNSYPVLTGVTRPDGTRVQFNYGDWGIITDIQEFSNNGTLRSEISYNFPLASAGQLTGPPTYTQKTVTTFDANGNKQQAVWSYEEATANPTPGSNVVTCFAVTDHAGTINMTSFHAAGDGFDGVPVRSIVATGSNAPCSSAPSTVLRTTDTQYTSDQDSSGTFTGINARPLTITQKLEDGQTQLQMQFTYDSNGNPADIKQSDFGSGNPGPLLRETVASYATNVGSILGLPADVQIKDGSGNVLSHQTFTYDNYSATPLQSASPLPPGFDSANFSASSTTPRGNLTGATVYTNASAGTGAINSTFAYDIFGNQLSAQSGCCTQTAAAYSATTQYAYPDSVSTGPSNSQLTTSFTYDMSTGRTIQITDPNRQQTEMSYDIDGRLITSTSPDQITTTNSYDDAGENPGVSVSSTANSLVSKAIFDFLGRPLTREILNGSSLVSTTSYINDPLGRPLQISNPYGPSDTPVYSASAYDALGRQTSVTPPALAGVTAQNPYQSQYAPVSYTDASGATRVGMSIQTIDPAGQPRMQYFDALGRLVRVDEPTGGSVATSATGSATVNGGETSAQVVSSPATPGTGSVQLSGAVQWATVSSATTAGATNITINGAEQQNPAGKIPGTGTITLGGAEQVIAAITANGSVTINGNLQSTQVQTQVAAAGSGYVTISGAEKSVTTTRPTRCITGPDSSCPPNTTTTYDAGIVTITVNGHSDSYSFGQNDNTTTIASGLSNAINNDGSAVVRASVSGATVYLTARTTGSGTNYSLSASETDTMGSFSTSASGTSLTGGQNTVNTTVYDSGSCTVTVASHGDSNSWSGSGTTAAGIASALASAITSDNSAPVSATASSNKINLNARTSGAAGNYSLASSCSYDSSHFSSPSFTASNSGSALTGGKNAIYDAGTASISVDGHTNSVSFNSSATAASIASSLASNINGDTGAAVTATASNATVTVTAKTLGTISNYPMSAATSYDTTDFTHPSFTATPSGAALTGGAPNNNAVDSGTMTVTVNGKAYTVSWGASSTPGSIASALASALGADTTIAPTLSGSTIFLNSKTAGTQYSFSTASTYDSADFSQSSFATANSVSDYGTTTITVNGHNDSVFWTNGASPSSVASAMAAQINGDSSAAVNASASGSTVSLTARSTGTSSNFSLASSTANDTAHFSASSFTTSNSGTTLVGGINAVYKTVYDSGTVTLTINGTNYTVSYGQNDTTGTIEGNLAAAINAGGLVDAAVSGGHLVLTADGSGSSTNYSVSATSSSSQPSLFPAPSFGGSTSGSTLTGGADATPGTLTNPLATFYSYDALGNLLQVSQGQQTRTYSYDSLGRVTSSCVPEVAGQCTTLTYNDSANPRTVTRTDPRKITSTRSFDAFNRVYDISYSDGTTPEVQFTYGAPGAANHGAGRLVSSSVLSTANGSSKNYQYDMMGRPSQITETLGGNSYTTTYNYSNGQLSSIAYPSSSDGSSGTLVSYNYDAIGRLSTVAAGSTTVYSVNSYSAAGAPLSTSFGNGMSGGYNYNNQLQLNSIQYGSATTPAINLTYGYGGALDNDQIQEITDNLMPSRSTSYAYDALGRLQQAQTVDQTSPSTWKLKFTYDRYGNRLSEAASGGAGTMPNSQLMIDPTSNHVTTSGFGYDPAGNMTSDSFNEYVFDGANRITAMMPAGATMPTATYVYDESGLRVNKNGNFYIYSGGQVIAEYANGAAAGSPSAEYIYAGGQRVATLTNGAFTYHYWDHLSVRSSADGAGNVVRTYGSFPFGETWYETGTANKWKFTTYENDSESGLNYANARFHSPALGRFMSLDPLPGSTGMPQSLNRYAYVSNDPVNFVDLSGLAPYRYLPPPTSDFRSLEFDFLQIDFNQINTAFASSVSVTAVAILEPGMDYPYYIHFGEVSNLPDLPDLSWLAAGTAPAIDNAPPVVGSGWAPFGFAAGISLPFAIVPKTNTICIGLGLGVGSRTLGINVGPMLAGNLNNADAILSGLSVSTLVQATPWGGTQTTHNAAGFMGGLSFGSPGISENVSYSWCSKIGQ